MRKIFFIAVFISFSCLVNAQYSNLKAVAIQTTREMWVDNGEIKSNPTEQCYTFSFKDKVLCHNVYSEGSIYDAQFYSLNEPLISVKGEEIIYTVRATSGLSGKTYIYEVKLEKSGTLISLVRTQPDGTTKSTFSGELVIAKSFLQ